MSHCDLKTRCPQPDGRDRLRHAVVVLALVSASCIPGWAQFQRVPINQYSSFLILPQPPRELRRALSEAEKALDSKHYSEAVEALIDILDSPETEDYFIGASLQDAGPDKEPGVPSTGEVFQGSMKQRAQELLGSMPLSGRKAYELQVGAEARRLLDEAIAAGDVHGITNVSRRFFHTRVGYEATMLLARYELDQGRPLASAMHLKRLAASPAALALFDAELPIMLAVSWHLAGKPDDARQVIEEHYIRLSGAKVVIGGKEQQLPTEPAKQLAWIESTTGDGQALGVAGGAEWHLFRGGPARNGEAKGGMPLSKVEWEFEAAHDWDDEKNISATHAGHLDNGVAAIPAMQPLAVGDQLLVRTARLMLGVDLKSGARVWPYPEEALEPEEATFGTKRERANQLRESYLSGRRSDPTTALLTQRIWQDAPYAQMSSDGQRLFLLRDLTPAATTVNQNPAILLRRQRFNKQPPDEFRKSNRLVALELATQGKTLWTAGGTEGEDPALEDAFFLGCPLPIEGHLFVIAEIKDEIKLLAIDPATGQLEWSQQLAQVEALFTVDFDPIRRLAGATPSFADGVLVCPTSSGSIVAVELASRTLLWAHTYERHKDNRFPRQGGFNFYQLPMMQKPGEHWADSTAIIADGHVVLTPTESNKLHCLDLVTGKSKWPPKARGKMLFVAAVHAGVILVVEHDRLRGVRLSDGSEAWPMIQLGEGELPTGRGFRSGDDYYFPTNRAEIVKVNIVDGEITTRQPTERILGNLICHGDYLISQGPEGVVAYALRARKRATVIEQMKSNADDPELLEDFANLLISDGKTAEAIEAMRRAVNLQSVESLRQEMQQSLIRFILAALREDFAAHRELINEVAELSPTPPLKRELARVSAEGLASIGEAGQAFQSYLGLIATIIGQRNVLKSDRSNLQTISKEHQWRLAEELYFAKKLNALLADVDSDNTSRSMIRSLREQIAKDSESLSADALRGWSNVVTYIALNSDNTELNDFRDELRIDVARQMLAEEKALQTILMLESLAAQDESPAAAIANEMIGRVYAQEKNYRQAAWHYDKLAERWGDQLVASNQTGSQLRAAFQGQMNQDADRDRQEFKWPTGKIKFDEQEVDRVRSNPQWYEVAWRSTLPEWLQGSTLAFSGSNQTLILLDKFGQVTKQIPIGRVENANPRAATAQARGRLLYVSFGVELFAIDLLNSRPADNDAVLWRKRMFDDHPINPTVFGQNLGRTKQVPFEPIDRTSGPHGELGHIGPVTEFGVCVIRNGDLECLDALTGELRWTRRNIVGASSVFGDERHVYLCRNATGKTQVFDILDGREIRNVDLPQASAHWDTFGRQLLYYEGKYNSGRDLEIRFRDPDVNEDMWSVKVAGYTKAFIVDREELAILEPDGKFTILRLSDGKIILEQDLIPEKKLKSIRVVRSRDQYLVTTNRDDRLRTTALQRKNIHVQDISRFSNPKSPRITGHMYAFNRSTNKMSWQAPISVEQYSMILPQAPEVPLIVFARKVIRKSKIEENRQVSTSTIELAIVDRRTGGIVLDETISVNAVQACSLATNIAKSEFEVTLLPKVRFTLRMTADPPEPKVIPELREVSTTPREISKEPPSALGTPELDGTIVLTDAPPFDEDAAEKKKETAIKKARQRVDESLDRIAEEFEQTPLPAPDDPERR